MDADAAIQVPYCRNSAIDGAVRHPGTDLHHRSCPLVSWNQGISNKKGRNPATKDIDIRSTYPAIGNADDNLARPTHRSGHIDQFELVRLRNQEGSHVVTPFFLWAIFRLDAARVLPVKQETLFRSNLPIEAGSLAELKRCVRESSADKASWLHSERGSNTLPPRRPLGIAGRLNMAPARRDILEVSWAVKSVGA